VGNALAKEDIQGIIPPLCTPFDANEDLDLASFRREIRFMLDLRVRGVVVGGSTGEGYALAPEELAELCQVAVEEVHGRASVIAGIIATSDREAIHRGKLAREVGVNALMLTPAIFELVSDDGMVEYYDHVWRDVGLPIVIYNHVVGATALVSPRLVERLVAEVPGIVGIKESGVGQVDVFGDLIRAVGDKIALIWAHDSALFAGYSLGASASISGINTVLPELSVKLFDAVKRNDLATARELHFRLAPVAKVLVQANWNGTVKAAINLQGRPVGPARRPFIPVSPEQEAQLREALAQAGAQVVVGTARR
jgi:4-hydroxy-tetrahydrodipicolinate synthase